MKPWEMMKRFGQAAGGSPLSVYAALVAAMGATHHYRCDETSGTKLHDVIGGVDLTLTGTYTLGVASFNGDSSPCVQFSNGRASANALVWGAGNPRPLTLACWAFPTSAAVGVILDQRASNGDSNGSLQYRGGESPAQFRHDKYPPSYGYIGTDSYAPNNCYFFVFEEQAGSRKIWINNVLAASDASPENYTGADPTDSTIGANRTGSDPFIGMVKDVSVIPAVLSAADRTALWDAGKP